MLQPTWLNPDGVLFVTVPAYHWIFSGHTKGMVFKGF
jgi:hypothetical protein